ncbi:MAG: DUF1254 domain-containing protein [Pseudomonadota bacterium]
MIRLLAPAAAFAAAALAAHFAVLHALPGLIMTRAMQRLEASGAPANGFTVAPRMTPQTQTVVRPSPDLAYSICLFDISDSPAMIAADLWPDYASLSIYDARTDNVAVVSLSGDDGGPYTMEIGLAGRDAPTPGRVLVDKPRGVALIRRLAPTAEAHLRASAVAARDSCEASAR